MSVFLAAPALPLHSAGKYVAGAYIVFVALILIYVAIMALRLGRNEREIRQLHRELLEKQAKTASSLASSPGGELGAAEDSDREREPVHE